MELLPKGNWIVDCPHSLQAYVGCNDETTKELAGLVYEFATDYKLQDSLREGALRGSKTAVFSRIFDVTLDYDVFPQLFFEWIVLHRYERPPFPAEVKETEKIQEYWLHSPHDDVRIPLAIPDIIRAFGEYAGKEVDSDIIAKCSGFYDDSPCKCPVCGKNWERTWDK